MATAFQSDEQLAYVEYGRAYQRAYYAKNRDKKKAYARQYHQRNKEAINSGRRIDRPSKNKARGIAHPSKREYNRVYHYEIMASTHLKLRLKALQLVCGARKPICCKCGVDDVFVLAINHKNGGGRQEVKHNPGRWWKAIVSGGRGVSDLDVRCQNCNILYEYERGRRRLPRDWREIIAEETA